MSRLQVVVVHFLLRHLLHGSPRPLLFLFAACLHRLRRPLLHRRHRRKQSVPSSAYDQLHRERYTAYLTQFQQLQTHGDDVSGRYRCCCHYLAAVVAAVAAAAAVVVVVVVAAAAAAAVAAVEAETDEESTRK
jgi:hypothetical protein